MIRRCSPRRANASDYKASAIAYETAANGSSYYTYDFCYAAEQWFDENPPNEDSTLADGRACVDASVKNTVKSNESYFTRGLPSVYRYMAAILDSRGVYQQALEYIKESISASPDTPQGYSVEADIFHDLQRNSECISAEQQAIRLSDGKYPYMQFRLGTCYFETEDWVQAANSFRLAAQADTTDASSAFNLALALQRQGFEGDAKIWLRKALDRKPDEELRQKILNALK
jgi:tetratricopeptide (TPR) repeat protein